MELVTVSAGYFEAREQIHEVLTAGLSPAIGAKDWDIFPTSR